MSINWVMLAEGGGYTPLPGETTLYQSPPRTTLSLQSSNRSHPSDAFSQQCKSGVTYLTNRRIIYLPVTPTPSFTSFAVPILNVSDSRVTAPWFGANKWEAVITPVAGGGIPATHLSLDLTMEFKEGGAFDFATTFERLRERLRQAVDVAGETGGQVNDVHLEDLPAYEDTRGDVRVEAYSPLDRERQRGSLSTASTADSLGSPGRETFQPPREPPPGYEEVQMGSVADEWERQLRRNEQ